MANESLVDRLYKRAAIRRGIPRKEPDRISDILEEAAKKIDELRLRLQKLQEDISDAIQDDGENGVRWMNDEASKEWAKKNPRLLKVLNEFQSEDY